MTLLGGSTIVFQMPAFASGLEPTCGAPFGLEQDDRWKQITAPTASAPRDSVINLLMAVS